MIRRDVGGVPSDFLRQILYIVSASRAILRILVQRSARGPQCGASFRPAVLPGRRLRQRQIFARAQKRQIGFHALHHNAVLNFVERRIGRLPIALIESLQRCLQVLFRRVDVDADLCKPAGHFADRLMLRGIGGSFRRTSSSVRIRSRLRGLNGRDDRDTFDLAVDRHDSFVWFRGLNLLNVRERLLYIAYRRRAVTAPNRLEGVVGLRDHVVRLVR